jgi:hypothetical protein
MTEIYGDGGDGAHSRSLKMIAYDKYQDKDDEDNDELPTTID